MQSISVPTLPSSSCYPIPSHHLHFHRHSQSFQALSFSRNHTHFPETYALDLDLSTAQRDRNSHFSYPVHDFAPFQQFYSSADSDGAAERNPDRRNRVGSESESEAPESEARTMWWGDWKAAVGQRLNVAGIVSSAAVVFKDRRLLLPHVAVADIRCIDWAELRRRGFKGVVFDKDNTITVPYSLTLYGPLGASIERCKSVFGDDIAVFSNSAGLFEYDRNGSKARQLEAAIGIKVIRHRVKKPAGSAEEVEEHFGCDSSQLIMVGDRPFTDIVYGNRNGFLTILTEPLSLKEEPFVVRQVRKLETSLLKRWIGRGRKPTSHSLLPDAMLCVKNTPLP